MEFAQTSLSGLSNLKNWWGKDQAQNCLNGLSDNEILNIANDINGIFSETDLVENREDLTLPKLVVVGTQSSGKSSVLNSIMGMDILPTDENMCTRTPLDICLIKLPITEKNGFTELGYYNNGWVRELKIPITIPIPSTNEINQIREFISRKTIELAGDNMNISSNPIVLRIYSPHVPNLSLTDLPGLTMVACTDKGQPEDIKERIENLVINYIKQPRTIIIGVMVSRSDLEVDQGLALIKKHDFEGKRTIGVLTKPDLMNQETHIGKYLTNSISRNLKLTHGYYCIKNRTRSEMRDLNVLGGIESEKNYFLSHPEYKKSIYKDRIGIKNLTSNLSKELIASITEMIPSVMTEIITLETIINQKIDVMGQDLPSSVEGKVSILNKYASNFCHQFVDSIESRGKELNIGKLIKDIFVDYRTNLVNIKPFNDKMIYDEDYFMNIASSFEGNHMSYTIHPIKVLEACMVDDRERPLLSLLSPSLKCVDSICDVLIESIRNISSQEEFYQYPPLVSYMMAILIDEMIGPLKMKVKDNIKQKIQEQEDYIWTESREFAKSLMETTQNSDFNVEHLRNLLDSYFSAVKDIMMDTVPKAIMSIIIKEIEKTLLSFLFQNIVSEDKIYLLKEDENIEKQRKYYSDIRSRIDAVKKVFSRNIKN